MFLKRVASFFVGGEDMKKKILSAILCATMVIGMLAGCGSKPAAEADKSTSDDTKTESTKGIAKEDIKVGFVHV